MSEGLSGCNAVGPNPHFSSAESEAHQRRLTPNLHGLTPWLEVLDDDITLGCEPFHKPLSKKRDVG